MASTLLQRRPQRRVAGQAGHRQHQLGGTASGLPANTRVHPWVVVAVVVVVVVAVVACVPGVDGALEQAQVAAAMVLLSLPVTAVPAAVVVSVAVAAAAAVGL